jgi:hypothetical protein
MTPTHRRRRFSDTVARRLGLEPNSLRRASDRTESSIVMTLLLVFIVGAPLLGLLVGRAAYESSLRTEQAQAARHRVAARLTADSPVRVRYVDRTSPSGTAAQARWTYAGVVHTGPVPVRPGAKAGATVTISVDGAGRPVVRPRTRAETINRTVVLSSVAVISLGFGLWTTRLVVRAVFIRRRLADWDAAWSAFEPRWSGRTGA